MIKAGPPNEARDRGGKTGDFIAGDATMDGDAHSIDRGQPTELRLQKWLRRAREVNIRVWIGLALAVVLLALFVNWITHRVATVSTNDARVAAELVAVSSDISGRIVKKNIQSGDAVSVGDVLYEVDDREARFRLAELEADVVRLKAEIAREAARVGLSTTKSGSQFAARDAESNTAQAALASARSELETARREFDRTEDLFNRGFATEATLDIARDELDRARFAVAQAQSDLEKTGANKITASVERDEVKLIEHNLDVLNADLMHAEAKVEGQRIVVDKHKIRSPINGVVDELFYDVGEHSLQGFRMALLHDPSAVWIKANIKETEVRHIVDGAHAEIRPDSLPGEVIDGTVGHVGNVTLAEAALMPNPNASGVFTKITQRIEVQIDLPNNDLGLKPGTMVRVKIDKTKPAADTNR